MMNGQMKTSDPKKSKRCAICYQYQACFPNRKYFSFPADEEICKKWIAASNRPYLRSKSFEQLHKNFKICSEHFKNSDYATSKMKRLKPSAVPSLNSDESTSQSSKNSPVFANLKSMLSVKLHSKENVDPSSADIDTASASPEPPQTCKTLQDFKELFLRKENCDVVIKVQEQEFPAHRAIFAARSPVFAKTFQSDMKEKTTFIVNVEDCNPSAFFDFFCYLYCEDTGSLSSENVFSIFTAAVKYDVSDLKAKCLKFMEENLSVDTFCDTIALALLHAEVHLIRVATDFFIQNALEILETVKWQSFLAENPTQSNELFIRYVKSVNHPVTVDNMN